MICGFVNRRSLGMGERLNIWWDLLKEIKQGRILAIIVLIEGMFYRVNFKSLIWVSWVGIKRVFNRFKQSKDYARSK